MCGIAGAVWYDPEWVIDEAVLERMTDRLRHRGPDDAGCYWSPVGDSTSGRHQPRVALGFRRLAIIDLQTGHQPLCNEDGTVWVVFNGEIYNYRALRRRLEGNGHRFRTQSDTETIVHLYEDEGIDCFRHLNGMFAIAIWDGRHERLVLARDRFGEKPLVYYHQSGRLAFASELKSLLEIPGIPKRIDYHALDQYFTYQYVPYPHTIYRDIAKLPPAHYAVYDKQQLTLGRYWNLPAEPETPGDYRECQEQLRWLLEDAVALRLQSDVPLGAFLSGGIDSSLVVALMQKSASHPVRTFSIGFPDRDYDERRFAEQVARHVGTEHETFEVTPDAVAVLPELVYHYDEPFADSSAIPTWYLAQLTRQHVTVALTGDGGDELFLGYPRYWAILWSSRLERIDALRRCVAWRGWQRLPAPARQKSRIRQWKRFCETLALEPAERYVEWVSIFSERRRAELYSEALIESLPDEDPRRFLLDRWPVCADSAAAAARLDLETYLPCDLMCKVDTASMAHSLECRQPFLDHRLAELVVALPRTWKLTGWRGKQLLRHTFFDLLPRAIWQRSKMGFGVPLDIWFRGPLQPLAKDLLLGSQSSAGTLFRREAIERWLAEHISGTFNHAYRLWALLVFEAWRQKWNPEL
ncbi:MAG: asparagine synthetase B [Pirellulaceae bacterium]|nr:MAG: asparagine synthetase B [Pirellulaceae bacterium]